jgi:hypothetical protein
MRVEVLKLGSSLGRSTQLAAQLESINQGLHTSVSRLSSDQRIVRLAKQDGMTMPGPMDPSFVSVNSRDRVPRAIGGIAAPDPTTFLSGLATEQAANGDGLPATDLSAVGPSSTTTASTAGSTGGTTTATTSPATGGTTAGTGTGAASGSTTAGGTGTVPPASGAGTSGGSTGVANGGAGL